MPMPKPDPSIERLKERGWEAVGAINQALAEGRIDEDEWHVAMASLIKPAYLTADNPYAAAGHGAMPSHGKPREVSLPWRYTGAARFWTSAAPVVFSWRAFIGGAWPRT